MYASSLYFRNEIGETWIIALIIDPKKKNAKNNISSKTGKKMD